VVAGVKTLVEFGACSGLDEFPQAIDLY